MYGYIYKTTNLENSKLYIGQHRGEFNPNYFGSGTYLRSAFNKYGKDKFRLEIIIHAEDKNALDELEKQYIKEYREKFGKDKLYNLADGGSGNALSGELNPFFGRHHSKETVERIRKAKTGHSVTREWVEKMKQINTGRKHTQEEKDKIRQSKIGKKRKPFSKEHRDNMRKAHLKNKRNNKRLHPA